MRAAIPGQANTLTHNLIRISDSKPLTTGTVSFYLLALSGAHAGKWWNGTAWATDKAAAGAGEHKADGLWQCSIAAGAWEYGVLYEKYAMDSGDLSICYSEQVVPSLAIGVIGTGGTARVYTVTDSVTGLPVPNVTVWVTSDAAGTNILYRDTTNALGQVTFYLPAGTWYYWRDAAGYEDVDPDVVTHS
jgi:hypothetical protein